MFKRLNLFLFSLFLFGLSASVFPAQARTQVTDWYIQSFDSQIVVNKDSSLDITETITADCGNASGKHGIFRILPEEINIAGHGKVKTPVKLKSITDANGHKYKYTTHWNNSNKTVTWKIGDAKKTVQGVNVYVFKYQVKNAIRFYNKNFDEFYWNLTGNFWDLEINKSHIKISFPSEIKKDEMITNLYSGVLGAKDSVAAKFFWDNDNNLVVKSTRKLSKREGITVSVTFPKGIFTAHQPTFMETYGRYFFSIIPILVFLACFILWFKYGRDPHEKKTVIAEYDVPGKLSPIMLGMLEKNGRLDNKFITAEIVNLAVNGIIKIEEIKKKVLFFTLKDYNLIRLGNMTAEAKLNDPQKSILNGIFITRNTVKLSSLKNEFYKVLKDTRKKTNKLLEEKDLIFASGLKLQIIFLVTGVVIFFLSFWMTILSIYFALAMGISGIIIFVFSFIMTKRTEKGTELNWRIKGFKLFMQTVNRDRAVFYEKENMFEKCLPYAIVFNMTEEWINRINEIYGADYFATHTPAWYIGESLTSFNAESFSSAMNNLSNSIASNTSSSSGSGGAGGSGGGGGGGGGGGW